MKKNYSHSSDTIDTLLRIANQKRKKKLTYQHILETLGDRAFGIALLFFTLPSALPFSSIPGVSFIFSIPIFLFACQLVVARKTLWLPHIIAKRTISQTTISKVIHSTIPYLTKIEYLLKFRWKFMTCRFMEIVHGVVICCLSLLLMLPIPLSNFIFAGLLIIFSLGLIEKDGLFLILAYIGTIIYVSFIYLLISAAITHLLG